jgi:ankyrin repeat protein
MTGNCALHVAAEAGNEEAAKVLIPLLDEAGINQRNLHLSDYSQGGSGLVQGGMRQDCGRQSCGARLQRLPGEGAHHGVTRHPHPHPNPQPQPHPTLTQPPGSWVTGSGPERQMITPWNKTALAIAVETGDEDMARLLLDAGGVGAGRARAGRGR